MNWTRTHCFFFQAEDGIRDIGVTGVQTCALPILPLPPELLGVRGAGGRALRHTARLRAGRLARAPLQPVEPRRVRPENGRAAGRGRVGISGGGGTLKKKRTNT